MYFDHVADCIFVWNFFTIFFDPRRINKVAALLDYAPKAWFGMNAKYFKLKYSGAFDDKNA